MSVTAELAKIEELFAAIKLKLSGATPDQIKLDKKKAELAALEAKVSSKSPDKDEEKKTKLREQIAKLEMPKPAKAKAVKKSAAKDDDSTSEDDDAPPAKGGKAKKPAADEADKKPASPAPKSKAAKAEASADEAEKKPAKAAKPAKAKADEEDVRVPKIVGALLTAFTAAMTENGLEVNAASKKAFGEYANAMTSDEYAKCKLETHMTNFASIPTVVTVSQLRDQNSDLVKVSACIYRNTKTKKLLTGPSVPEDDEMDEDPQIISGVPYYVGTTKIVYRTMTVDDEEKDVPVGYWGVGEFYEVDL
jgi:hypothetical protein